MSTQYRRRVDRLTEHLATAAPGDCPRCAGVVALVIAEHGDDRLDVERRPIASCRACGRVLIAM